MVRISLPTEGLVDNMCHRPTSAMALTLTLTKGLARLQQRDTPCPPNSPAPNPAPVACREGGGRCLLMPAIQMGLVGVTRLQGLQSLFSPTLTPSGGKQE